MDFENRKHSDSIIYHWVNNLVGTGSRFSLNLLLTIFGGAMYSFQVWSSPYVLVVFGVISPLLFTLCLYFLIRLYSNNPDSVIPSAFKSKYSNTALMLFDMTVIILFAVLIHADVINYLFFRLLQTVIFPIIMIFMLRVIFIQVTHDGNDDI